MKQQRVLAILSLGGQRATGMTGAMTRRTSIGKTPASLPTTLKAIMNGGAEPGEFLPLILRAKQCLQGKAKEKLL